MDEQRFDDVVRTLSERGSRRGVMRLLAGGILGVLAGAPAPSALAKPKKKKKKSGCPKQACPPGHQRNKRTCKCECTRQQCSGGKEFDAEACACRCPRGMRECRDGCVGPDRCCPGDPPCPEDPKGCCHAPGLDVCTIDGCCRELDGMMACNNFCVDTKSNRNHCGSCEWQCNANQECCDGSCTNILTDEENCGGCGIRCDTRTQACSQGRCQDICSLNIGDYRNACDDGVDYWCCPDGSTRCCRLSGQPHCC
jgi:hypothetical protein